MSSFPGLLTVGAVLTAAGLALAACGGGQTTDAATPRTAVTSTAPATPSESGTTSGSDTAPPTSTTADTGIVITTARSEFGTMLFDRSGQAIYLFDKESTSRAECYAACATAWPPVLTQAVPRAAGAARSKLLGTTERADGSTQVTYGGHPLYYYAHEGKNQVLCHNVTEFGGRWLVVSPDGTAVA